MRDDNSPSNLLLGFVSGGVVVAVLMGFLTLLLLPAHRARVMDEFGAGDKAVRVLTARDDIGPYTVLARKHLSAASYPRVYLPPNYIPKTLADDLVGNQTRHAIRKGQPILTTALRTRHSMRAPLEAGSPTAQDADASKLGPLVERLQRAYAREARPDEIEGAEAGWATGAGVYDFIHEDQDAAELDALMRDAFDVPDSALGIAPPLSITRREWDCDRAPCLAVLEVEGESDLDCRGLRRLLLDRLSSSLPLDRATTSSSFLEIDRPLFGETAQTPNGCRFAFQTWTEDSAARARSIDRGMWGFLEGILEADMDRMNKLWPGLVEDEELP